MTDPVMTDTMDENTPVRALDLREPGRTPPTLPIEHPSDPRAGQRREVFALDEGDVVLVFPDKLSLASYDDLEGYVGLFLKKAKRRAQAVKDLEDEARRGSED